MNLKRSEKAIHIFLLAIFGIILLSACDNYYAPYGLGRGIEDLFIGGGIILRIVIVIVGLALLLAGFAIYEFLIQLVGFLTGGVLGAVVGGLLADGEIWGGIVGFIIGGILGAALALILFYIGIFLGGAFGGAAIFGGLWAFLLNDSPPAFWLIIGGILGGIAMIALHRFWITALTAALGAILFGLGISAPPIWWILFFFIGMGVQYGLAAMLGKSDQVKPGYTKPSRRTDAIKPPVQQPPYNQQPGQIPPPYHGPTGGVQPGYNQPPQQPPGGYQYGSNPPPHSPGGNQYGSTQPPQQPGVNQYPPQPPKDPT